MPDKTFNFSVPIFKADGEWRFSGLASTTSVDRQGERISEKAIQGFKEQLGVPLCLGDDHRVAISSVESEIGFIDSVGGDPTQFVIEGPLFKEHPYGNFVYSRLSNPDSPPNWKLSIGGRIREGSKRMEWDSDAGMYVAIIDAIELDHVYLCRGNTAVNQDTWITGKSEDWGDAVFKAASDIEVPSEEKQDNSSSLKAEDNIPEADIMPDVETSVPAAEEGEKVSVGTLTNLIELVKSMLVKSEEEAPAAAEAEVVPEPDPEPEIVFVTVDQMTEAVEGMKSALLDAFKEMLAEKAEDETAGEDTTEKAEEAEAPAEEPPVEEGAPEPEEETVSVSKAEFDHMSEMITKLTQVIGEAGPGSAQLPVADETAKAWVEDDGYPDVLSALTSHPELGPAVARSLASLVKSR